MTAGPAAGAVTFEALDASGYEDAIPDLADILADAVDSGSSVNFLRGFSAADAAAYWAGLRGAVAAGAVRPIVARLDGQIVGVALVVPTGKPNSPHRAEVNKVLVHRRARRRGIGSGLMSKVEEVALAGGQWLLLLDTAEGSDAEAMYRRLGWRPFGIVPDHSTDPDGAFQGATYFWKDLRR